jgi:protein FLOWERING LOCUS T
MAAGRDTDPLVIGRVVGDVLDPFVRTTNLRVSYDARTVANGCELRPSMVAHQPRVQVGGPDMRTFYTLVRSTPPIHTSSSTIF